MQRQTQSSVLAVLAALLLAGPASASVSIAVLGPASLADREAPAAAFAQSSIPIERIADDIARDIFWVGIATSADLLSTGWCIAANPRCYESNPFGPNTESRIALKLGTSTGILGINYLLRRRGHTTVPNVLRWIAVGIPAAAAVNNSIIALREDK